MKKGSFFKYIIFTSRASMIFLLSITLVSIGLVLFSIFSLKKGVNIIQENRNPGIIELKADNSKNSLDSNELNNYLDSLIQKKVIKKLVRKSKEEGLKEMSQYDLILDSLTLARIENGEMENPLPDIINVCFFTDYHNMEFFGSIKGELEGFSCVNKFRIPDYNKEFNEYKGNLLLASSIFSIIFFIVSILLIYNNIKLSIYNNRVNIKTMQLVGATKSFIQAPFIKQSIWSGFQAGIISIIFLLFSWQIVCYYFNDLKALMSYYEMTQFCVAIIFIGILISFISTFIVLRKVTSLKTDVYD